uniref:Uncharacterized protein n=1 Tax=Rhizophora mucronata TaxID=61149 RepID=A0A2P2PZ29_RHIMU
MTHVNFITFHFLHVCDDIMQKIYGSLDFIFI